MTENEIRKTIEIDAAPEVVFQALTNIEDLTQWFPDKGTFEPRIGGKMRFTFLASSNNMDCDHLLEGEVLEIVPNKKLSYTFVPGDTYKPDGIRTPPTIVVWNIEEIGKNKTRVTLVHSGFTKELEKMFKETTEGWNYFTGRLVEYCKKKQTSSTQDLVITRIFDAPRQLVWNAWTDPERFKHWWGPKGFTVPFCKIDLRMGGAFFYCMRSPEGKDYWSTGVYREIVQPEKIICTDCFADEKGNVVPATHYGMSPDFPLEMQVTVTFEEYQGKTKFTLRHVGIPSGADHDGAQQGWSESFDKLVEYLR